MEASDDEDDADSDKDFDYLMGKFHVFQVFLFSSSTLSSFKFYSFQSFNFSNLYFPFSRHAHVEPYTGKEG